MPGRNGPRPRMIARAGLPDAQTPRRPAARHFALTIRGILAPPDCRVPVQRSMHEIGSQSGSDRGIDSHIDTYID